MEKIKTPEAALAFCESGNAKHVAHNLTRGKAMAKMELEEADPGQKPWGAVLSCADSRVIPEFIFGAKVGDLFVTRVAGNISSPDMIASLEYAVSKLGVKLIIVLGHEFCGAVHATIDFAKDRLNLGYNLNGLVSYIVPAVNAPTIDNLEKAVKKNAQVSAQGLLTRSTILSDYHARKKLIIVCGYYEILTGKVTFYRP